MHLFIYLCLLLLFSPLFIFNESLVDGEQWPVWPHCYDCFLSNIVEKKFQRYIKKNACTVLAFSMKVVLPILRKGQAKQTHFEPVSL